MCRKSFRLTAAIFFIVVFNGLENLRGDPESGRISELFTASLAPLDCSVDLHLFCLLVFHDLFISVKYLVADCLVFSQDSQVRQSTTYSLHQPQGNKEHGTERSGYLHKKSDG